MCYDNFPSNWFARLGFKLFAVNNRFGLLPNIWCFCLLSLDPAIIHNDDQQISFTIKDSNVDVGLSVVYASTNYVKRRQLWHSLTVVQNSMLIPWACIGDFNTILGSHEHRGFFKPAKLPMEDFANWTDGNSLLHLPTKGSQFTWMNGRQGRHCTW
jgi:hypothetical protein